ncbi:hypothetical protein [Flavobacterium sp. GSB-24]|uniref:hypothetical protein n=1 Tax=Flavobacterium sp. GSB-24 TaxID=2994319 RepID=UPI002491203E|nr:hypothetical protein [Flavobacterium sp. GSB-24]BDU25168.1 hypothetical protein FLGSB24_19120 [Flavobacterium sp. GSB-24]
MRQFSSLEKDIVKRLVEWEVILQRQPTNHFMITFDALINDISVKYNGKMIISVGPGIFPSIEIQTADPSSISNHVLNNHMTRSIINTVNFLDYLSKSELIYFISKSSQMPVLLTSVEIGNIAVPSTIHTNVIDDNSFFEKIRQFYSKDIYPTQTLIDYYNNDYKSDEEIKHIQNLKIAEDSLIETRNGLQLSVDSLSETRKGIKISEDSLEESRKSVVLANAALLDSQSNLKVARFALWSALALGFIGILGSVGEVYYAWKASGNNEVKLDSIQLKKLEQYQETEAKLHELLKQNRNDTILTKVINFPKK